ncbi:unnamed protein product [Anisakis simplex]|uniref:Transmembrane protein n=1 Tax=Anisakis simplex TaxID=6269 RepID=A0A0M3JSF0_ANISI|nr:unnamed protein product [Anisakis simplex]
MGSETMTSENMFTVLMLVGCIGLSITYKTVERFDSDFRLPSHFMPTVYDLKLSLSSDRETICGQVK